MKAILLFLLLASSAPARADNTAPGAPGTATPQPYSLPRPPAMPANPHKPPLLQMPEVQRNEHQPSLPQLEQPRGETGKRRARSGDPSREAPR